MSSSNGRDWGCAGILSAVLMISVTGCPPPPPAGGTTPAPAGPAGPSIEGAYTGTITFREGNERCTAPLRLNVVGSTIEDVDVWGPDQQVHCDAVVTTALGAMTLPFDQVRLQGGRLEADRNVGELQLSVTVMGQQVVDTVPWEGNLPAEGVAFKGAALRRWQSLDEIYWEMAPR